MNHARGLHQQAMEAVDDATLLKKSGDVVGAKARLMDAYRLEAEAALVLRNQYDSEPSRSVLFRSAASIAMQCELYEEAEKLIHQALGGEPPHWIATELRQLLEQVSFSRHLKLIGVELLNIDVQVVLEGPGIGSGIAPTSEVLPRVDGTNLLFFRTAERLAAKPYREAGPPTNDIREQAQAFITIPRAASYAFSLRVGSLSQKSFDDPSERVLDELMDCLDLVERGKEEDLRERIPDPAYYNNFVALAKNLLPDGESVRTVGFTIQKAGYTREVALRQTSLDLKPKFPPATSVRTGRVSKGNERPVTVTGQLRLADSTHESDRLKLVPEKGAPITVYVPEGMMADIVKPLWDEWVSIEGLKMGKVITLMSINRLQ